MLLVVGSLWAIELGGRLLESKLYDVYCEGSSIASPAAWLLSEADVLLAKCFEYPMFIVSLDIVGRGGDVG